MRFLPFCMMIVREEAIMELAKQEKKELLKRWKAEQNKKYLLNKTKVRQLFRFLQKELKKEPCDHTLKKTAQWVGEHCPPDKLEPILQEMRDMGGFATAKCCSTAMSATRSNDLRDFSTP